MSHFHFLSRYRVVSFSANRTRQNLVEDGDWHQLNHPVLEQFPLRSLEDKETENALLQNLEEHKKKACMQRFT